MGATGWQYTTPYDPDPEEALQRLRHETFAANDYLKPWEIFRDDVVAVFPFPFRLMIRATRVFLFLFRYLPIWSARGFHGPRSIDEALNDAAESGTHSILDITHTADFPEFGAATPLSRHRLLKHFGTLTPTRAQVDAAFAGPDETPGENVDRWEAVYFAVHDEAGTPIEYVFVGASGD